ncbi:MAG: hypothetical protein OXH04_16020 [Acidobacteria bacterium]|nr:hypothetical protein [Acidobacteriota bacterium]
MSATRSLALNPAFQTSQSTIHIGYLKTERIDAPGQRPDIDAL